MTFLQKFNQKITDMVDVEKIRINLIEHVPHLSAETMSWLAVILLHLATIPTLVAMLTGLTEKLPPVDMVLFSWVGLFFFFIKGVIQKDWLNVVTIGFGFFCQAALMALILFK